MNHDTPDLEPGVQLGKYVVESTLGRGAVAVVYRVRHRILGTTHALKVLAVTSASLRTRLIREGRVQARLRHPNVVPVTDVVEAKGAPGLLADFVDGPTLEEWLLHSPGDLETRLGIFRGIAAGVEAAHEAGVVHRDLKPSNVLLETSPSGTLRPRVNDFGIARVVEGNNGPAQTRAETMMGTPAYMAPEQFKDAAKADARADIFSLGCILYELVTGRRAFPQQDLIGIAYAVDAGDFVPPRELRPDAPAGAVAAVHAALRPGIEDRPATVAAMVGLLDTPAELLPAEASQTIGDLPAADMSAADPPAQHTSPPTMWTMGQGLDAGPPEPDDPDEGPAPRRRPWALVAFFAVLFLGGGGVGLWLRGQGAAAPAPADAPPSKLDTPAQRGTSADAELAAPDIPDGAPTNPEADQRASAAGVAPAPAPASAPSTATAGAEVGDGGARDPAASGANDGADRGAAAEADGPPEPATAPEPAPAPARPSGTVQFVGGAASVALVDSAGGRHAPGTLPAGTYRIMAEFQAGAPVHAGDVRVGSGGRYELRCISSFQQCRVEER